MSGRRQLLVLGIILAFACALLMVTFRFTESAIFRAEQLAAAHLLTEALGNTTYDNDLLATTITLTQPEAVVLNQAAGAKLYLASRHKKPQVILLPVTSRAGYGGPINLVVGVSMNGDITGVRAIHHRETPGLGGKIDLASSSTWMLNFQGKSVLLPSSAWRVKAAGGEFDQIAGATITSSAVIQAIYVAQRFFVENKGELLARFNRPVEVSPGNIPLNSPQADNK